MALYHKELNNLEELQREKEALKQQLKDMESQGGLLSFMGGGKDEEDNDTEVRGTESEEGKSMMENIMSVAGPVLSTAMDLAFPVLGTKIGNTVKKTVFKGVKSVAGNVVGGYLKWKAVELSAKALWRMTQKPSKKKD